MEQEFNHISKKKSFYEVEPHLIDYLKDFERYQFLPVSYDDLIRFEGSVHHYNEKGEHTLWQSVFYSPSVFDDIKRGLVQLYQMINGHEVQYSHLTVGSIDFCSFGNSKPFRIKIINEINDNHDYIYLKRSDSSRIYGLELESILSPNKINFLTDGKTIVEEHISGLPADEFIVELQGVKGSEYDYVRITKEFVKFNERCFIRLLGDMRAYNFVVVITKDFDKNQYRFRAIDFDQQSFEGRKNIYLPQYFKDNYFFVEKAQKYMSKETADQYTREEQGLVRKRILNETQRYRKLIDNLKMDRISTLDNINNLKKELHHYYKDDRFLKVSSMGELVELNVKIRTNMGDIN